MKERLQGETRLATILKRSFRQGDFPINTLESPALLQKGIRLGPAKWRVTVSRELRFMKSYLER